MPDVSQLTQSLQQLARACANAGAMRGYSDAELQQLARALTSAADTHARIDNELARRKGVAEGWIPAPSRPTTLADFNSDIDYLAS